MTADADVEFIMVGRLEVRSEWSMPSHSHEFHEMIIIERGSQFTTMLGREHCAAAGDVLLYPRGVSHEERAGQNGQLRSVFVSFQWPSWREGMPLQLSDETGRMRALGAWLADERPALRPGARPICQGFLSALVAEYLRLTSGNEDEIVRLVREFVQAHMREQFGLGDLARCVGLSKYYFSRRYRELTGHAPVAHVRLIRLEAARNLLLTTDLPLKAIAPRVGLASEYHLSRLLKKHLGLSARQLRRRTVAAGGAMP